MKSTPKTITNYRSLILLSLLIILGIIILDQVTKNYIATHFYLGEKYTVIPGFFNFAYARNSGAAFSFGGDFVNWQRYLLFLALPVAACIWLITLIWNSIKCNEKYLLWTYSLILGGAIGNLIDRFRLDYVVDFFDFYYGRYHFATFNIADAAISVAAGLLILDYFFLHKQKSKNVSTS